MKHTESQSHVVLARRDCADRRQVERRRFERGAQTIDPLGGNGDRGIFGVDVDSRSLGAAVRKEKWKISERGAEVDKAKAPPQGIERRLNDYSPVPARA
jgi:hypothetical protein